ncbi:leucine-rich repeat domain-containing protein [Acidovorax sp.]|uniref:leucine-rich repeat domain-containing protein n=1 Tax=Acidovorax sp. TaxID=1872122 RepID=UPI00262F1AE8|nr:leucine-rich repeat domain-containing protein [Acidovorax sp.]
MTQTTLSFKTGPRPGQCTDQDTRRRWLATGMLWLLPLAGLHAQPACAPGETAANFSFTGAEQSFVVPSGVSTARFHLLGAQGGDGIGGGGGNGTGGTGGTGGAGAAVSGTHAVTVGETLSIWVGGQGSQAVNPGGLGGLNALPASSRAGNGGGATDVRRGGNTQANRIAIAAGGGGGGNGGWGGTVTVAGGNGGASASAGTAGNDVASPSNDGPYGGGGGAPGTGGAPGAGCATFPATAGAASGNGGTINNFLGSFSGAGAGGGGGGGATVGGGGGGSGVGFTSCSTNWNGGGGGGAGGVSDAMSLGSATITQGNNMGHGSVRICYIPAPAPAAIPAAQRQYLLDLYNATTGAGWTNRTGWQTAILGSECTWFGVTCDAGANNVTQLNLSGNNLVSSAPLPNWAALPSLQTLDLENNRLTGSPPSIASLSALQRFEISDNQFTGSLPNPAGLAALTRYSATDNQFTGTIPALAGLPALQSFHVQNNQLTGPVPALPSTLLRITVQDNQLSGAVPAPPASLLAGQSTLCANPIAPSVSLAWDTATGQTPWHTGCTGVASATAIPTLNTVGLLLTAALVGLGSALRLRKRR